MSAETERRSENSLAAPPWRQVLKIEAPGLRSAAAIVTPILIAQAFGHVEVGVMVGLGGLYVGVSDREGSTPRTLLLMALLTPIAGLAGTLAGGIPHLPALMMFVFAFMGGMAAAYGDVAGNMGFLLSIVFAVMQGLPGNSQAAFERMGELALGGLWGMALTLLLWRYQNRPDPGNGAAGHSGRRITPLRSHLRVGSPVFQHGIRLAVAAALAVMLSHLLKMQHGYWLVLTVIVILKPDFSQTKQRAFERIGGSLLGGIVAVMLVAVIHNTIALDVLLALLSAIAYSHNRTNYGVFVLFLTPFIVVMLDIASPGNWKVAIVRVANTLIGGGLAILVALLLMPRTATAPDSTAGMP